MVYVYDENKKVTGVSLSSEEESIFVMDRFDTFVEFKYEDQFINNSYIVANFFNLGLKVSAYICLSEEVPSFNMVYFESQMPTLFWGFTLKEAVNITVKELGIEQGYIGKKIGDITKRLHRIHKIYK